ERLSAALEYHHLALRARSDATRFMNMWIALESLSRGTGGSIVQNVCQRVAPTIAAGNIRKQISALYGYIFRNVSDRPEFLRLCPKRKTLHGRLASLVLVLRDKVEGEKINKLYELIKHDPVLCYRIDHMRRRVLATPEDVADNFVRH